MNKRLPTKAQNRQRAIAMTHRAAAGSVGQFNQLLPRIEEEMRANADNMTADNLYVVRADIDRVVIALDKLIRSCTAATLKCVLQTTHEAALKLEQEQKISNSTQNES